MIFRWLPPILILAGSALLLAAGVGYYASLPEPETVIDDPERTLSNLQAGQSASLTFSLHNPKSRSIRIIGLAEC